VHGALTIDGIEEETMLTLQRRCFVLGLALLLTGCGGAVLPTVSPLPMRTLQVATPTPYVGRVQVISAHERDLLDVPAVTGGLAPGRDLGLDLVVKPAGVFLVVTADLHNTDRAPLDLADVTFALEDGEGWFYTAAPATDLALSAGGTLPFTRDSLPAGARRTGTVAFDVRRDYTAPLRFLVIVPGRSVPLTSAPFTPER
jgi:hypothetical protein